MANGPCEFVDADSIDHDLRVALSSFYRSQPSPPNPSFSIGCPFCVVQNFRLLDLRDKLIDCLLTVAKVR